MRKLIVLLLVLAIVFLVIVYFRNTEGFANQNPLTPLTKENVQALLDSLALEYLAYYESFVNLKSKDLRIINRIKYIGSDINILNEQYPTITTTIEKTNFYDYRMITLEDLKTIKEFITRRVGSASSEDLAKPADLEEIDLISSRLNAFFGVIKEKASLYNKTIPDEAGNIVRTVLENLLKLKLKVGSMKPEDVPLLKSDMYWNALARAQSDFIDPAGLVSAPPLKVETQNLPVPECPLKEIQKALEKTDTTITAPLSVCPPEKVCPPDKVCPTTTPIPEGIPYSELIKKLLVEQSLVGAVNRGAI